jgi:hypothetical protein
MKMWFVLVMAFLAGTAFAQVTRDSRATSVSRTYQNAGGTTLRVLAFYVLEGELEHVVNGRSVMLSPGMVGTVRPPAMVRHKTSAAGARALVIWAPGGEVARVTARWRAQ